MKMQKLKKETIEKKEKQKNILKNYLIQAKGNLYQKIQ